MSGASEAEQELGARVGERRSIGDARAWLRRQLDDPSALELPGPDVAEVGGLLSALGDARRAQDQEALAEARAALRDRYVEDVRALMTRRLVTDAPYAERLAAFWSNHLCISVPAKPQLRALAGHYERTAIRPWVLGRFEEMVLASARHPAMLFYLDNFQSIGPGSPAGRRSDRRGKARGLNETYARELVFTFCAGAGAARALHAAGPGFVEQGVEKRRHDSPPRGFAPPAGRSPERWPPGSDGHGFKA